MRIFEIADAEAQLALWKLVNDSVWTAIQTQQHEQAKQKAAAQQQKKSKRSKRISKRHISAPAPIPKIPKPMPKLAAPNKPIANPPQQPAQKHPTLTNANLNPQPYPQAKTAYPPKPLPTTSTTPTANASSPTNNVATQINPIQQQRQQPLPPQNALSAQKKRVLPNKRA
jgi:hypothetical protein